jgi:integrase
MQKDQAEYLYRMALDREFRTPAKNGDGSGCFPPQVITLTDRPKKSADIISMKPFCNGRRLKKLGLKPACSSPPARTVRAIHLLEHGYDIRTVQELSGHNDVTTTMVYTQVFNRGGKKVRSPADAL